MTDELIMTEVEIWHDYSSRYGHHPSMLVALWLRSLISWLPLKYSKLFQESLIRPDSPTSLDILQSLKTLKEVNLICVQVFSNEVMSGFTVSLSFV